MLSRTLWLILCLSPIIFAYLMQESVQEVEYLLLVDAGSTGSRAFVFRLDATWSYTTTDNSIQEASDALDTGSSKQNMLQSRKVYEFPGLKIKRGISTFAHDKSWEPLVHHLLPMFVNASFIIPRDKWNATSVYIKGTAGMRLLDADLQIRIWDHLVHLNAAPGNPFLIKRENMGTIEGNMEAYYAVLASNYIAKSIDARLRRLSGSDMVGALDMGGGSTQLIFYSRQASTSSDTSDTVENEHMDRESFVADLSTPVNEDEFWSHSWLGFGAETIRARIEQRLIVRASAARQPQVRSDQGDIVMDIHNPCTQVGYTSLVSLADGSHSSEQINGATQYLLIGTGQPEQCTSLLFDLLWPSNTCSREIPEGIANENAERVQMSRTSDARRRPCYLDSIGHPPVQGHYYAMSVYFYAYDSVRLLLGARGQELLPHWPTPTIEELESAAHTFCRTSWQGDEWHDKHPYTNRKQLPHRCFESLYILLVLHDAFGFARDSRQITFALDVEGHEVEWALGFALADAADTTTSRTSDTASVAAPAVCSDARICHGDISEAT